MELGAKRARFLRIDLACTELLDRLFGGMRRLTGVHLFGDSSRAGRKGGHLRILMVSRGVLPVGRNSGGAELVAFHLAGHLADHGEEVVLVSDVDPAVLDERVPSRLSIAEVGTYSGIGRLVTRVPMDFPRWLLQHLLGNVQVARRAQILLATDEQGFDVVHVHGALAAVLLYRKLRTHPYQIPLVYTEHDSTPWSCRYRRRIERSVRRCVYRGVNLRACRAATAVVANFPSLANELAMRAGISQSRFTTIRNAADGRWLSNLCGAESMKARHGFDRYCLFVGSLVARKGPDILLHALTKVGLPCIFVGDGPMRATLERLASRLGIADRVVFTGSMERRDVHRYYSEADALVLPSVSEGVPLVAIEALGAGVPVVASNLAGIASVVRDRENGLLVDPGDEVSLARALFDVENDEVMYAELKQGAESSSQAIQNWSDVVHQLCALYAQHQTFRGAASRTRAGAAPAPADTPADEDLTRPLPAVPTSPDPERAMHA